VGKADSFASNMSFEVVEVGEHSFKGNDCTESDQARMNELTLNTMMIMENSPMGDPFKQF